MKKIIFFMVLSTLLFAKSIDQSTIEITFEGNKYITTPILEEVVGVKKPSPIAIWREKKAKINSILLPKLDEMFKLFYKTEGFYDAQIEHKILDEEVHFIIVEHKPIMIESIEIESDLDLSDDIVLQQGSRFRSKDFTEMKQKIRKHLLSKGYCSPKLNTKAYIDLDKYSAVIKIQLQKRKVCYFGDVTIETDSDTMSDDIILSRLHFEKGDVFDINKIKDSYESLYALEAFDQLNLDYSLNFYNNKPVKIKFKEIKKNIYSRIGIGYSTDLKFQGRYHWEYKNFRGNGKKLIFDALLSEKQKMVENSFFFPYLGSFHGYHIDFQNSFGYSEENNLHSNYDENVLYDKLYFSHKSSEWYHSIGLGVESRNISEDQTYFLIYPFMKIIYDMRDSKLNPKKGIYFSHEMEYGLPYSPDSTTYLKYMEELRLIYTLDSDVTLSAVGQMGAIQLYDNDMPESKKFFGGGAFSNRAYGYAQIGVTDSATEVLTTGGYTLANLSLEANFPIYKNFRGAVFSDNTMISENQGIWEFSNRVVYTGGVGLRYLTPMGPFKIDLGFNLKDRRENSIHFQVGQSF